jgi:membrane associated rhomboid family serine protease
MFPALAPITRWLILANVLVYGLEMLSPGVTLYYLALWPWGSEATRYSAPFMPWQLVTHGFMHSPGNYFHIVFNMFSLFMFGSDIERSMGARKYLTYYFVCVIGGGLLQMLAMAVGISPPGPLVGASGAVFGILLAFGIAFPYRRLVMLPIPIPLPAWLFVIIFGASSLAFGLLGYYQSVAHFAHLGGALAGYLLILYWRHGRR